jgi:hypothetical protein
VGRVPVRGGFDLDDPGVQTGPVTAGSGTGQHGGQPGAGRDCGDPAIGPGRVERHEGRARLEDRQQRGHHLGGAAEADAHRRFGARSGVPQPPRQPVGAAVELAVGEPDPPVGDRLPAGEPLGVRGDHLGQGRGRDRCRRVVPVAQDRLPLAGGQQVELPDGPVRRLGRGVEQPGQPAGDARGGGGLEQVRVVFEEPVQPVAVPVPVLGPVAVAAGGARSQADGQVELRGAGAQRVAGGGHAGQVQGGRRGVPVGDHDLEQRVAAR